MPCHQRSLLGPLYPGAVIMTHLMAIWLISQKNKLSILEWTKMDHSSLITTGTLWMDYCLPLQWGHSNHEHLIFVCTVHLFSDYRMQAPPFDKNMYLMFLHLQNSIHVTQNIIRRAFIPWSSKKKRCTQKCPSVHCSSVLNVVTDF